MTRLYVPSVVLDEYIEEGTVYKFSLLHDKKTTVSLPPFLAFRLQSDIDRIVSKHVRGYDWEEYLQRLEAEGVNIDSVRENSVVFVIKPEDEDLHPIQQRLLVEGEEQKQVRGYNRYESGRIRGRRVACRYVVTDLLMRGLYGLHRRLEARLNEQNPDDYEPGSGEKKLELISFREIMNYGASGIEKGLMMSELLEKPITFNVRGDKKLHLTIYLPEQVYGAIRRHYPLIEFSSFLAYCIALRRRDTFDELTRYELFRESDYFPGAVQDFELKVLSKMKNAEQELEEPERPRITSMDALRAVMLDELKYYRRPDLPFTLNHIASLIIRYNLEETFGENAISACYQVLAQLEREGLVRRLRGETYAWQFVGREGD